MYSPPVAKARVTMKTRPIKQFLKNELREYLFKKYLSFKICSEADLHCLVSYKLSKFIKQMPSSEPLTLLNKCPFKFKREKVYPDITIFRGKAENHKPWVAIELKEVNRLKADTAEKERRLLHKYKKLGCKCAYLLYVARRGNPKAIKGGKKHHAYYFSEISIIMEREINKRNLQITFADWEKCFKCWKTFGRK